MAGYSCEQCGASQPLFPGGASAADQALGVPVLGRLPFDARIARCCDQGVPFVIARPEAAAARVLTDIAAQIARRSARGDRH